MENGEGILDVHFTDGSFLSFPVEVKVGQTPPSWDFKVELWPDTINIVWADHFMFLKPPTGIFMPNNGTVFDIPLNCVWGAPLYYKGAIAGNPLNFAADYNHPGALNLIKKVTESNIFHDMSLCQTKGQGQGDIGILRNFKTFWKNFNKKELARCNEAHPMIKIPRQELFRMGHIQPMTALKLWLYRGKLLSPNTSYELARKALSLPKKLFIVQSFRRQILKSGPSSDES
jgi:predicted heme/steroid binding protein